MTADACEHIYGQLYIWVVQSFFLKMLHMKLHPKLFYIFDKWKNTEKYFF